MMKKMILGTIVGLGLMGCSTPIYKATPLTDTLKGSDVVCSNGCSLEWERASFWINKHSKLKLQNTSPTLLETYNPYRSGQMGFSVSKEPLGNGKYKLHTRVSKHGSMVELVSGAVTSGDVKRILNHYIKTGEDKSHILQGNVFTSPIR